MTDYRVQNPVVMVIFKRPETTERVLAQVAKVKPSKLLVVADGPRPENPGEDERCTAARAIIDRVDWDCEVLKNYSDQNLGCRMRVSTGMDWVFDTVDRAIILEDDIVPHPTFFRFCDELLEKYADDQRIGSIGGSNLLRGRRRTPYSYYFSRVHHVWGWAGWARSWKKNDAGMELWPTLRDGEYLRGIWWNGYGFSFLQDVLELIYRGEEDTWDLPWNLSCWAHNMLAILPGVNLTANIGFGADATHSKTASDLGNMETHPMDFPLVHPPFMIADEVADARTAEEVEFVPRARLSLDGLRRSRLRLRNMIRSLRGSARTAGRLIKERQFAEVAARTRRKLLG